MNVQRLLSFTVVATLSFTVVPARSLADPGPRVRAGRSKGKTQTLFGPKQTPRKANRCKRDADCTFLRSICASCTPCGGGWRMVGNRAEAKRRGALRARIRCKPPAPCRGCPGGERRFWLGQRAVCQAGVCRAAQKVKLAPRRKASKANACMRDRDCVLASIRRPTPCICRCPASGVQWRRALNRKAAAAERALVARGCGSKRSDCPPCARTRGPRIHGELVRCVSGQCRVYERSRKTRRP